MSFFIDLSIIGGGLTGTAMLWQCIRQARMAADRHPELPSRIRLRIFEKQTTFGPGFPHNQDIVLPFHITNMCASDMGIFPENPEDFHSWTVRNRSLLIARFHWLGPFFDLQKNFPAVCDHYPRAVMGEYLTARFLRAVTLARQMGITVEHHCCTEVCDMQQASGSFCLSCHNTATGKHSVIQTAQVLIATGHWQKQSRDPCFFPSPWPAQTLAQRIPMGAKVGILGTSLSAIETLLTLTSENRFARSESGDLVYQPPENTRTFCLFSRKGLLPKVRGRTGSYRNRYFCRDSLEKMLADTPGTSSREAVFSLLNAELQSAYGHPFNWDEITSPSGTPEAVLAQSITDAVQGDTPGGDVLWQTVLSQGLGMVKQLYLNLTPLQRRMFEEQYASAFFTHAATQPIINAEKLLALIRAGIVRIIRLGSAYRLLKDDPQGRYVFVYKDPKGSANKQACSYLVDARGQEKSILTDPSLLTQSMVARGIVLTEEYPPADTCKEGDSACKTGRHDTGSIWINPDTHQVMQRHCDGQIRPADSLYAVGAMTRGQIIDASMAKSIVRSVSKAAAHLFETAGFVRHL
ncbi:MAG TPA: FAD/NAD(P)-binding protein [Desulfotignum sp.]|nr:FAD/NAD(P)-binding protein [Desulfotignum sp.]